MKRAIQSALYERTGLSTDKTAVLAAHAGTQPLQVGDVVKTPYVLEFLGLEQRPSYSESELEQAIIDHLQTFLLELGRGFCFEARQKRLTFDNEHLYVDLVFYHRIARFSTVTFVERAFRNYGQTLQPVLEAIYYWGLRHYTCAYPVRAADWRQR
ncbi:PDDEXK nuclease domain-containing protein [Hymenobacter sp. AT01-02]|uniref:PDDEXK nuclease domain-containing protein n=1 Tax=Hymenobacter sp. AT01-02 TaxID=1571877 RepID=UPI00069633D8|nr:PDDEXK nuclease domain-containing protein [Hymenobacter sp. AT01-02]